MTHAKETKRNHHGQAVIAQNVCVCVCMSACATTEVQTQAPLLQVVLHGRQEDGLWNPNTWVQILTLPLTRVEDLVHINLVMAQLSICKVIIRVPTS